MNNILRIIIDWFGKAYLEPSLKLAKVKAAIYYLKTVKAVRGAAIGICLLLFVLMMVAAGLVMIPVSLILWAPWSNETKVIVGLVIGAVYLLIPIIAVSIALSEKRWMKMTGANNILEDICTHD